LPDSVRPAVLAVREPIVAAFDLKFVVEARPETYRLVDVAFVPVALAKVKFWSVVDEVTKSWDVVARVAFRLARVVTPDATLSVPVKLAAEEIVWPL
jgi:hypothetical protein